ncbi:hypothetical protein [Sandarakinorhabdus sp.]|uniref:hypothetical protein n=1 Tax=Sandarakinorhabdus sp. TaxID=1916663 RepID=UPI003F70B50E
MGIVNYFEEIVDRHIEQLFESEGYISKNSLVHDQEQLKSCFRPLLSAIESALEKPEFDLIAQVEKATWEKSRAENELRIVNDELLLTKERHSITEIELSLARDEVLILRKEYEELSTDFDRWKKNVWKNEASLKRTIDELQKGARQMRDDCQKELQNLKNQIIKNENYFREEIDTLNKVKLGLKNTINAQQRSIKELEKQAMRAQVSFRY